MKLLCLAMRQTANCGGHGLGQGNVMFDGPGENGNFRLEKIPGYTADRYKFRTSPLGNVAPQAAFFHNGSLTTWKTRYDFTLMLRARRVNTT
jgi:cytochrome c peroxidase